MLSAFCRRICPITRGPVRVCARFLSGFLKEDLLESTIEVKAGVGGDEAHKWATELFEMYRNVSLKMDWDFEETAHLKAIVRGESYGWLKYESGVHRVQRIPYNSQRMQTSAASVIVIPDIEIPKVVIRDADLKVSISKKSSGAGGQSVNAAYQQVRMTHIPSGYTVVVNESHAQQENREIALAKVKERVEQMEVEKVLAKMAEHRKGQIKFGDRSEKIRSYNFQRNEINEHRLTAKNGGLIKESVEEFMTECDQLVGLWQKLRKL
jgi:peptide chain release factor 1